MGGGVRADSGDIVTVHYTGWLSTGREFDSSRDGAPINFKAWVCSNPECGFNIRIDNGEISFGRTIGQSFK